MAGAAITITVLALAAAHTQHIQVDFFTALLLSLVATISACGASGVAGGSLLLIPLACNLFNIPNDIAMQVVAVGYIIGVIQDSCETALNSSTDVLFTAAADIAHSHELEQPKSAERLNRKKAACTWNIKSECAGCFSMRDTRLVLCRYRITHTKAACTRTNEVQAAFCRAYA